MVKINSIFHTNLNFYKLHLIEIMEILTLIAITRIYVDLYLLAINERTFSKRLMFLAVQLEGNSRKEKYLCNNLNQNSLCRY